MNEPEQALVREAMAYYDLANPHTEMIRQNENLTCRIIDGNNAYALRIRCPAQGFSLKIFGDQATAYQLMRGETDLLLHLSRTGSFPLQTPVLTKGGDPVCILSDGSPACLLHWLEGETLKAEDGNRCAHALGVLAARIHKAAEGFSGTRLHYSQELIRAMQKEIDVALLASHLTARHASICRGALNEISAVMTCLDGDATSKGLIHADLGFNNVLCTPNGLAPIDFSLSGYGYKAQECGMIASNYSDTGQRQAVYDGYAEISGTVFDPHHTEAFFALSVLLFITSQHERFYRDEWFAPAMDRWCNTCFAPLNGETV
ncbi:MAG: phosphotransferase [Bacillota bacterium]|nr:phosphotransferase [Bacillota bacterium]